MVLFENKSIKLFYMYVIDNLVSIILFESSIESKV